MKTIATLCIVFCCFIGSASAADKVVVVPLGGNRLANQKCPGKSAVVGFDGSGGLICNDKTVFVSSQRYNGDLGGIAGANEICNTLAMAAGLTGEFRAWISLAGTLSPDHDFSKDSG